MTPSIPLPYACEGVLIRKGLGEYVSEPQPINRDLEAAVTRVNPGVALTMSTDGTQAIFDVLEPHKTELMFQNGSQIQIYDSMAEIAGSIAIKKIPVRCTCPSGTHIACLA